MKRRSSISTDITSSPTRDPIHREAEEPAFQSTETTGPKVQRRVQPRRGLRVLAMVVGMAFLGLGLTAAAWMVWRSTDSLTETFSERIDQVIIEDVNGRVTLEAGATTEMTVEQEWLFSGAPEVEMVVEGGTLRITSDCGSFCRTHVSGIAPAEAGILVRTEAGGVDVTGFEGGVDLTTSAGGVVVDAITGPAVLRTDAGWIRGVISDGDVDAQTSAGGIDLEVLGDFSRISATSNAGNVRLTVPDDVYRLDADSSAGFTEINVATDPEAARVIKAHSGAGNVTIDHFPG